MKKKANSPGLQGRFRSPAHRRTESEASLSSLGTLAGLQRVSGAAYSFWFRVPWHGNSSFVFIHSTRLQITTGLWSRKQQNSPGYRSKRHENSCLFWSCPWLRADSLFNTRLAFSHRNGSSLLVGLSAVKNDKEDTTAQFLRRSLYAHIIHGKVGGKLPQKC